MKASPACLKVQVLFAKKQGEKRKHCHFGITALFVPDSEGYHFYAVTDQKGMNQTYDMNAVRFLNDCERDLIENLRSQNKTDDEIGAHLLKQAGL